MATKKSSERLFVKQMNQLGRHFRTQDVDFSRMTESPTCFTVNQFARRFLQLHLFDINDLPHCSAADTSIRGAAVPEIIRQFQRPDFNFLSPTKIFEFLEKLALSSLNGDEQSLACILLALQVYSKFLTGGWRYLKAKEATILICIILKYWSQSGQYGRISFADVFLQETKLGIPPSGYANYIAEYDLHLRETVAPPVFTNNAFEEDGTTLKAPICFFRGLAFVNPDIRLLDASVMLRCMQSIEIQKFDYYLTPDNVTANALKVYQKAKAECIALNRAVKDQPDLFTLMLTGTHNRHWMFKNVSMDDLTEVDHEVIGRLRSLDSADTEIMLETTNPYDPSAGSFPNEFYLFKLEDEIPVAPAAAPHGAYNESVMSFEGSKSYSSYFANAETTMDKIERALVGPQNAANAAIAERDDWKNKYKSLQKEFEAYKQQHDRQSSTPRKAETPNSFFDSPPGPRHQLSPSTPQSTDADARRQSPTRTRSSYDGSSTKGDRSRTASLARSRSRSPIDDDRPKISPHTLRLTPRRISHYARYPNSAGNTPPRFKLPLRNEDLRHQPINTDRLREENGDAADTVPVLAISSSSSDAPPKSAAMEEDLSSSDEEASEKPKSAAKEKDLKSSSDESATKTSVQVVSEETSAEASDNANLTTGQEEPLRAVEDFAEEPPQVFQGNQVVAEKPDHFAEEPPQVSQGNQVVAEKPDHFAEEPPQVSQGNQVVAEKPDQFAEEPPQVSQDNQVVAEKQDHFAEEPPQVSQGNQVVAEKQDQFAEEPPQVSQAKSTASSSSAAASSGLPALFGPAITALTAEQRQERRKLVTELKQKTFLKAGGKSSCSCGRAKTAYSCHNFQKCLGKHWYHPGCLAKARNEGTADTVSAEMKAVVWFCDTCTNYVAASEQDSPANVQNMVQGEDTEQQPQKEANDEPEIAEETDKEN